MLLHRALDAERDDAGELTDAARADLHDFAGRLSGLTEAERKDKRGHRLCTDDTTGRRVKCAPREPAKPKRVKSDHANRRAVTAHLMRMLSDPSSHTDDHHADLANRLKSLTRDQLAAVRREIGIRRAGRRKGEEVENLAGHVKSKTARGMVAKTVADAQGDGPKKGPRTADAEFRKERLTPERDKRKVPLTPKRGTTPPGGQGESPVSEPIRPVKINPRWLQQKRNMLQVTHKESPAYARIAGEIAAAEAQHAAWLEQERQRKAQQAALAPTPTTPATPGVDGPKVRNALDHILGDQVRAVATLGAERVARTMIAVHLSKMNEAERVLVASNIRKTMDGWGVKGEGWRKQLFAELAKKYAEFAEVV